MDRAPLTIKQILACADAHKKRTGDWPKTNSGRVLDTDETWDRVNNGLQQGQRGLSGGSSLAKLLAEHRSVRNIMDLPPLAIQQVLGWADEHKAATGDWPGKESGAVTGTDETWAGINASLRIGNRGLPAGSSLARLLAVERGVRNHLGLRDLTVKQILAWADAYKAVTGKWPNMKSGSVKGTDETWLGINASLRRGRRGLPGDSSLVKLFQQHRLSKTN